ncbi:hypothetical protein AgCh_006204 [Apium graveolens]
MRMLCDNTKSFHPLSHYGSARKSRIDRIISEKFHAPAINAASSELLEEKTNKSDTEFQEWDVTRSYVYILDRISSFVNTSNQVHGHNVHNNATPTYWETRANPAELRQRVSKVKKRKRARRGVRKPRRQSDKQKFPIRTERGAVSQPEVGTRFSEPDIILATAPTQLGRDSRLREFGVVLKMDWLSSNGSQIDYKGKKVKIRMPNGKEIVIKGQRQTHKFLNIAQAKQLLRKDSKAYLAYMAGTKRETPMLKNEPVAFMDFVNRVFKKYLDMCVIIFIDNILVYSKTEEEHAEYLRIVVEALRREKLFSKFSRCEFWKNEVQILGQLMSSEGVLVDPTHVEEDFAKISGPLTRPTCKTEKVVWNEKCEESFQELKRSLVTALVLALPDGKGDFVIYSDVPHKGLGCMLMQHGKVVAYASRQLKEYEKELNRRQRRWLELMKDYVGEILYHPGKANVVADALSSKERLKMLTTPEELVRELEEMEIEVKSPEEKTNEERESLTEKKSNVRKMRRELCEFAYDHSYHASIEMPPHEALYGRRCHSPLYWDEVGERKLLGPDLVQRTRDIVELIRGCLAAAQDRQRKYADLARKDREYEVGDQVFLKVSPWEGLMRFGKKGKLSSRYMGPLRFCDE